MMDYLVAHVSLIATTSINFVTDAVNELEMTHVCSETHQWVYSRV